MYDVCMYVYVVIQASFSGTYLYSTLQCEETSPCVLYILYHPNYVHRYFVSSFCMYLLYCTYNTYNTAAPHLHKTEEEDYYIYGYTRENKMTDRPTDRSAKR